MTFVQITSLLRIENHTGNDVANVIGPLGVIWTHEMKGDLCGVGSTHIFMCCGRYGNTFGCGRYMSPVILYTYKCVPKIVIT